jgi:hypothetical protein
VSYQIAYDALDARTNKLIDLLEADAYLHEGLPDKPVVLKGPPRQSPAQVQVYVFRERVNAPDYWLGMQGSDWVAQWTIACIVRVAGDPAKLEEYMSVLACNVMRCIAANRQVAGFWDVATPGPSVAIRARDDRNQTYEIEGIPVRLQWQIAHD